MKMKRGGFLSKFSILCTQTLMYISYWKKQLDKSFIFRRRRTSNPAAPSVQIFCSGLWPFLSFGHPALRYGTLPNCFLNKVWSQSAFKQFVLELFLIKTCPGLLRSLELGHWPLHGSLVSSPVHCRMSGTGLNERMVKTWPRLLRDSFISIRLHWEHTRIFGPPWELPLGLCTFLDVKICPILVPEEAVLGSWSSQANFGQWQCFADLWNCREWRHTQAFVPLMVAFSKVHYISGCSDLIMMSVYCSIPLAAAQVLELAETSFLFPVNPRHGHHCGLLRNAV